MQPAHEILDRHADADTDILDLEGANAEMEAAIEAAIEGGFTVDPVEMMLINEQFTNTMIDYLGKLFLDLAEELGALPSGRDVDDASFGLFKAHAKITALYELARMKLEIAEARSGLIVPDPTRPLDLDEIRRDSNG